MDKSLFSGNKRDALLYPYSADSFVKSVCLALIAPLISCIIARAPQYSFKEIGDWKLPLSIDAIFLIVASPLYFISVTWLLKQLAGRLERSNIKWQKSEIFVATGLTALLGISSIFLLVQFFVILSPAGDCASRPHFELLWRHVTGPLQIEHCMSSASEINKQSFYFIEPLIFQAWLNVILTAMSLWLLGQGWWKWWHSVRPIADATA